MAVSDLLEFTQVMDFGSPTPAMWQYKARTGQTELLAGSSIRDVRKGATVGKLLEVNGELKPGDVVVQRASDEIRDGSLLRSQ